MARDLCRGLERRRHPDRRQLALGLNLLGVGTHAAAWRKNPDPGAFVDIQHYLVVARTAERVALDFVFLADSPSLFEDPAVKPSLPLEPTVLLTAIGAATERIGLIATASSTFNDPYNLARRLASLDHITLGRAGWNAVSTFDPGAAANFGLAELPGHDERYTRLAEFVDVVIKLWDSWEDGAIIGDADRGVFADPARIHRIDHVGRHYSVQGPLNVPRSPQGRPVIVQAGASNSGRDLAARFGELVFTTQLTFEASRAYARDVRDRARRRGRDPSRIKILPGLATVIGGTEAKARARQRELNELQGYDDSLKGLAFFLEVDSAQLDIDAPIPNEVLKRAPERITGAQGFFQAIVRLATSERLTVRQMIDRMSAGNRVLVGAPEQIADDIERWFIGGAADGFIVMPDVLPSGLDAFAQHVVPELRRRKLFREGYAGSTLREHLGLVRPASQYEFTRRRELGGSGW